MKRSTQEVFINVRGNLDIQFCIIIQESGAHVKRLKYYIHTLPAQR